MSEQPQLETDPRFPSGRWVGFWIQKIMPAGRHSTELFLTFANGILSGEGRDWVGKYTVHGRYDITDGRCHWTKQYLGKHHVYYEGFNEGQGIWGTWTFTLQSGETPGGGFHIWPDDMPDPSQQHLTAKADVPAELVST